jgi:hypothetical protein
MYVSQRLKTHEHVGKAYNHRRLRSDERQTKKDEKSVIKDHKAWRKKDLKLFYKDSKFKTTSFKVQRSRSLREISMITP